MKKARHSVRAVSDVGGTCLKVSVTATPMTEAERQDLARAVADLVLLALPQLAASTPTAPAAGPDALEAA